MLCYAEGKQNIILNYISVSVILFDILQYFDSILLYIYFWNVLCISL